MGNEDGRGRTKRFAAYLGELASVLGDARRCTAMISYCTGLLLPSERKSVEPMAALTAPTRRCSSVRRGCSRRAGTPTSGRSQWCCAWCATSAPTS